MSDIIKLLPESVANQIAAGEVVQRPASVVKELLENAVDSGATSIDLVIRDAGKTLIQVIDNGRGMSVADARMAFERHATSKINRAEDLFAIRSFGFRGEALASIASVARVEMKTRDAESEAGINIVIEGSKFISQDICAATQGTNIQVKDLFFNIPARRQFLKSDTKLMMRKQEERAEKPVSARKRKQILSVNEELFDSLRTLRKELAEAEGVPPYVVFSDKTLSAMCEILLSDREAFLEVSGVGSVKLEKYGDAFIDAIKEWKSSSR